VSTLSQGFARSVLAAALGLGAAAALAEADGGATTAAATAPVAPAAKDAAVKPKTVRYTKTKKVDFGAQTVEGKLRRPAAALVTGGQATGDNGLLRLRESFRDRIAADAGEDVP
jgi:hypothetical protein